MTKPEVNSSVFVAFASNVNDTAGLERLLGEIDGIKRLLFKGKEGTIVEKAGTFMPAELGEILTEIEKKGLEPIGDSNQMRFLEGVEENLRSLPLFKITLAFEPAATFMVALNGLVSQRVGRKVILDIYVNQFIIAGAVLEYGGKYDDFSLAKQAEEVIGKINDQFLGAN